MGWSYLGDENNKPSNLVLFTLGFSIISHRRGLGLTLSHGLILSLKTKDERVRPSKTSPYFCPHFFISWSLAFYLFRPDIYGPMEK